MTDCKPCATPHETGHQNLATPPSEPLPFRNAVGALMHVSNATRPDICEAVNLASRKMINPTQEDWTNVKRIFRYLKGTSNLALKYSRSPSADLRLLGFADSDWANDLVDRKSVSGYLFQLDSNTISWNCKKQPTVALSTTEAEYMATARASQEGIWIQSLLKELSIAVGKLKILQDNTGCIAISNNPVNHGRTKHIDIRHHYLRGLIKDGLMEMEYCPTKEMTADLLAKALPRPAFEYLRGKMNLVPLSQHGGVLDVLLDRKQE
jgi:hypothetical protein